MGKEKFLKDKEERLLKEEELRNQQKKEMEDKDSEHEQVKSEKEFPYDVKICDIWGTTSKDQVKFPVQRRIIDSNVYLFNQKYGFKEPIPEDNDDFKDYKLEEVETQLKKLEKKVNDRKSTDNKKGLRQQIRRLKGIKSSIQLQGRGSYMRLDENGRPYFEFDRVGNFKMPVYKNIDKSLLKTPDEAKIKLGSELIKENEEKNGDPNKGVKLLNIVITILLVISLCTCLYFNYKAIDVPEVCANNLKETSLIINAAARKFDNSASSLENVSSRVYLRQEDVIPKINTTVIN